MDRETAEWHAMHGRLHYELDEFEPVQVWGWGRDCWHALYWDKKSLKYRALCNWWIWVSHSGEYGGVDLAFGSFPFVAGQRQCRRCLGSPALPLRVQEALADVRAGLKRDG